MREINCQEQGVYSASHVCKAAFNGWLAVGDEQLWSDGAGYEKYETRNDQTRETHVSCETHDKKYHPASTDKTAQLGFSATNTVGNLISAASCDVHVDQRWAQIPLQDNAMARVT